MENKLEKSLKNDCSFLFFMTYLFFLSKEDLSLARAEVEELFRTPSSFVGDWLLVGEVDSSLVPRLAFTREVHRVLFSGSREEVFSFLSSGSFPDRVVGPVMVLLGAGSSFSKNSLYDLVLSYLGRPPVSLSAPSRVFFLGGFGDDWFFSERVWVNPGGFDSRKAHNRPAPHPTSLHPKLARALVNLSSARKEVLDPFCGSGGILLEAGLMGLVVKGFDIDPLMIKRASINLSHFGVSASLSVRDALTVDGFFESIVTDLPYGRNSKASSLEPLYVDFLRLAKGLTGSLVVAMPSFVDYEKIFFKAGVTPKRFFSWRLHRSLSKNIFLL